MGFGTVAAELIFLIVIVIAAVMIAGVFKTSIDNFSSASSGATKRSQERLATEITITAVSATTTDVNVSVRNIGESTLDVNLVDAVIDGRFFDSNNSIETATDLKNPGLWDPEERILVQIHNLSLVSATTYEVQIETQNGITATRRFVP